MLKHRHKLVIITALLGGIVLSTAVQAVAKPVANYDFSGVSNKIQAWGDSGYYPGASIIVVRIEDNKVLYQKYFGNYTADTVTYEASSGKWLAAATIAALVDHGKLSWDDPASKWIPELTGDKGRATLRQLLSHTAGYPDYQPKGNPVDNYQTLAESVEHIVPLPANYPPGTHFQYGGEAMQVAGRMAELATGKNWETLFQENIAQPLDMTNTHFTPVDTVQGGHAPMLGGGARGTLADYSHFLDMIAHDGVYQGKRILSKAAVREMQTDQVRGAYVTPKVEFAERVRGATYNGIYGLGEWREELDKKNNAVLISSPSWAGAYPWLDKTHGVYGFFLTHVDTTSPAVIKDSFSGFWVSPELATLVRQALDKKTGKG